MITTFIVEDEKPALERLVNFLEEYDFIRIIGNAASGEKAAAEIDRLKPDLLFLDIHLADISGIDMLNLISHKPKVIFTTAYDNYALEAFNLHAVDYLLKPYGPERLNEAIGKAESQIQQNAPAQLEQLKTMLENWRPAAEYLRRIPSRIGDKVYIFSDDDVVFFNSENKLIFAHLVSEKFMLNYTLEQLQSRLDPEKFFRIHRSTIVNMNYIKTIETWFAGTYRMIVKDAAKTELTISRVAGRELRKKLGW